MKKTVAEKWVKALRGKRYKQGRSVLKKKTKHGVTLHCCLGVLCELYQQDRRARGYKVLPVKIEDAADHGYEIKKGDCVFSFADDATHLPEQVMRWAGMNTGGGEFDNRELVNKTAHYDLVSMNDSGVRFKRIADVIEKHVKEL